MPLGTPPGFPVAQVFCEQWTKLDAPFAKGLVADLNAALVQQFLHVSVAERKMVVQPDRVLDDRHWETVAVRLGIGHVGSAYPSPIKATQPAEEVEIKVLTHGRPEKSLFRHGVDALQEAIKYFGDGTLERFMELFSPCLPWKTRLQLSFNAF